MRWITVFGFVFAVLLLSFSASPKQASASDQKIMQAPPEPVYEVDPGERTGFVLSPGYWEAVEPTPTNGRVLSTTRW